MSIKQMPGRVLISLLLSVTGLLSGCASHNENASLLAKKQAQNISQNLPIKSAGYTLVLAQSSGTTVKMTIISEAGTQTTQTPDAFLTSYQRQMCADPTVKLMITEGINYSITINDTRTGNQYQRKLARVVFRDARIYLIQWLTKIRHTLNQRQSLNTDKEHLRKIARGMFWLMLLIISAKMAHSLWRYISFSAEYTAVSQPVNKPSRVDAKTFDKNDVQLISQQNWFGKYQPVAAQVKQPEPVPVAETRLNVVLRGIAFGARPGAVIEEGGKQQVYLQGETLGSHNAVIEEINRDHVMLRYQGKIERLSLAEEERSTVAVTNKKAVSDEAKQAVAEPAVSVPVEIPAAVRQALAKDPQKIFNYIQLTPVRKEGIVGYAAKPGADRSLFDASGFKEGDIAIALNQQDFTDPRAMIALMRQLPSMDSIQLTVLRKGARHDISIALR